MAVESVGGGFAELCCGQEWEARLTLVPAPPPPPKEPLHQQACHFSVVAMQGHWMAWKASCSHLQLHISLQGCLLPQNINAFLNSARLFAGC